MNRKGAKSAKDAKDAKEREAGKWERDGSNKKCEYIESGKCPVAGGDRGGN